MAKKRVRATSAKRENRVMLSFSDRDYEILAQKAKEERLPVATFARLLVLKQVAPTD